MMIIQNQFMINETLDCKPFNSNPHKNLSRTFPIKSKPAGILLKNFSPSPFQKDAHISLSIVISSQELIKPSLLPSPLLSQPSLRLRINSFQPLEIPSIYSHHAKSFWYRSLIKLDFQNHPSHFPNLIRIGLFMDTNFWHVRKEVV